LAKRLPQDLGNRIAFLLPFGSCETFCQTSVHDGGGFNENHIHQRKKATIEKVKSNMLVVSLIYNAVMSVLAE